MSPRVGWLVFVLAALISLGSCVEPVSAEEKTRNSAFSLRTVEAQPRVDAPASRDARVTSRGVGEYGEDAPGSDGMLAALAKIAKIRWFHEKPRGGAGAGSTAHAPEHYQRHSTVPVAAQPIDGAETAAKQETGAEASQKFEFRPRKFHCRPIRRIFLPTVGRMLPAYACELGSRKFVLSSERFLEDNRPDLDVSVDAETFQRLAVRNETGHPKNSRVKLISATLTQRRGEAGYGVRKNYDPADTWRHLDAEPSSGEKIPSPSVNCD